MESMPEDSSDDEEEDDGFLYRSKQRGRPQGKVSYPPTCLSCNRLSMTIISEYDAADMNLNSCNSCST